MEERITDHEDRSLEMTQLKKRENWELNKQTNKRENYLSCPYKFQFPFL